MILGTIWKIDSGYRDESIYNGNQRMKAIPHLG